MNNNILYTVLALGGISLFGWGCSKQPEAPNVATPTEEQQAEQQIQTATSSAAVEPAETTTSTEPAVVPKVITKPNTAPTTKTKPSTTQDETKPSIYTVTITSSAYSPQVIAGKAGDTIRWINKDTKPHTTASDGALLWDSGTIQPGASYSRVFKAAGSYPYHDGSTGMKGTVIIR